MIMYMLAVSWLWPDCNFAIATIHVLLTFQMILRKLTFPKTKSALGALIYQGNL